jgi:single-strand DNA-binding protein
MAKGLNKVQVIGYLGGDPDMRYTTSGSAVANFSIAVSRSWKDKSGQQNEETEWFRIVAWDKLGEICNEYLAKGSRVYIEGRLATRKWTDKEGNDRYTTEVVASDMIMLDSRGEGGSGGNGSKGGRNVPQEMTDDDIPF